MARFDEPPVSARDIPMRRTGWWALAALLLAGGAVAAGYWLHERTILDTFQASSTSTPEAPAPVEFTHRAETALTPRISSALATPEERAELDLSQTEASTPGDVPQSRREGASPSRPTDNASTDSAGRGEESTSAETLREALRKARTN